MTVIADSGSTKTQWYAEGTAFFSEGINPFLQTEQDIAQTIEKVLSVQKQILKVQKIYFYGAGCLPASKDKVVRALSRHFQNADIQVESDLLGAARALYGSSEGIVGILGTGSNAAYYDGKDTESIVSSLGYVLGDEGSGAALGKRLVADVLKKMLPKELCERFFEHFALGQAEILEKIYTEKFPNRFLASFCSFLYENQNIPEIDSLILNEFQNFFDRNVAHYSVARRRIAFVGSVAHFFERQLRQVADYNGFTITKILRQPMEGLIRFHCK